MSPMPWLDPVHAQVVRAFETGRMGHAQLLTGAEGLGKHELARMLAKRMLCRQATDAAPACAGCVSCLRFEQGSHGDFRRIGIELNEKTGKPKTAIGIEQIRDMAEWLALTAQLGGPRVVIIETAHRLNTQAANALLKTLEEPMPGRYLLLVTHQAAALPATIRSRCQRIEVPLPEAAQARRWLADQGLPEDAGQQLLALAGGNPGLALQWHAQGGEALLGTVRKQLEAMACGQMAASTLARDWLSDELTGLRLLFAAGIAGQLAKAWALGGRSPPKPAQAVFRLQDWIDDINRLRLSLSQPLRHDLGLAGLMHEWHRLQNDFRQD